MQNNQIFWKSRQTLFGVGAIMLGQSRYNKPKKQLWMAISLCLRSCYATTLQKIVCVLTQKDSKNGNELNVSTSA